MAAVHATQRAVSPVSASSLPRTRSGVFGAQPGVLHARRRTAQFVKRVAISVGVICAVLVPVAARVQALTIDEAKSQLMQIILTLRGVVDQRVAFDARVPGDCDLSIDHRLEQRSRC